MQIVQLPSGLNSNHIDFAKTVDHLACLALLDEASLEHKPGLVCPSTQGSHADMDYALFQRSIDALQGYFQAQCINGYNHVDFEKIRQCGVIAEQKMLTATAQINTHKGAIFNLGFASAAVGKCLSEKRLSGKRAITAQEISQCITETWQYELQHHLQRDPHSHGQCMRNQYGITGAIEEVASGFQTVLTLALPQYQDIYRKTADKKSASLQALFALISELKDTNIVWRGGLSALYLVQDMARQFLKQGGVLQKNWMQEVEKMETYFIQHHLSPGGSADLLGVTLFLDQVEHEFHHML